MQHASHRCKSLQRSVVPWHTIGFAHKASRKRLFICRRHRKLATGTSPTSYFALHPLCLGACKNYRAFLAVQADASDTVICLIASLQQKCWA